MQGRQRKPQEHPGAPQAQVISPKGEQHVCRDSIHLHERVLRACRAGSQEPQEHVQARDWRGGLCAEQAVELLRDFYAAGNPKGGVQSAVL